MFLKWLELHKRKNLSILRDYCCNHFDEILHFRFNQRRQLRSVVGDHRQKVSLKPLVEVGKQDKGKEKNRILFQGDAATYFEEIKYKWKTFRWCLKDAHGKLVIIDKLTLAIVCSLYLIMIWSCIYSFWADYLLVSRPTFLVWHISMATQKLRKPFSCRNEVYQNRDNQIVY